MFFLAASFGHCNGAALAYWEASTSKVLGLAFFLPPHGGQL